MTLQRFALTCAFFAHGCFSPNSGSTTGATDTDADSDGTVSDTQSTGSAVTSVTGTGNTDVTVSSTQPTDPSETMTTGPTGTDSDPSETQGSSGDIEPQCGDGVPVATELCFDDSPLTFDVGVGAVDLGVGDVDANDLLDIVVLRSDMDMAAIMILEADGVGGFIAGNTETAPPYAGRVRVVDVDDDGDDDVFVAGGSEFRYFRNEVAFFNTFDAPMYFGGEGQVAEIILADLDGDAVLDALVSQAYAHTWYRGVMAMGDWTFDVDFGGFPTSGEGAAGMIAGPFTFDGDDDIDVVGLNQYYSIVEVLTNDGNAIFVDHSAPSLCAGEFDGVRHGDWGDFDSDGNTDLVATCTDGDVGVALDDGTGMFASLDTLALAGAFRPTVVDLDRDGNQDLLVTSGALNRAVLFRNDGSGAFDLSDVQFMADGPVFGAAAADLNDDGALDVVIASGGPNSHVDVYLAMP